MPFPPEEDEKHEAWLAEISNCPKPPIVEAIDAQLFELGRIALFLPTADMRDELALDLYYDVLVRFCFLLVLVALVSISRY